MYADSERFYCLGCGLGGDVLDFIQHTDNRTRRPKSAALPPRTRPCSRRRRASTPDGSGVPQKRGRTWPRGASARSPQPAWASATPRAAGCGRPWNPSASRRSRCMNRLSSSSGASTAAASLTGS